MPPHFLTWLGAAIATVAYAGVAFSGGLQGYRNKGSKASLIAGSVSGVLLSVCAVGDLFLLWYAAAGAIVVAVLLVGRFAGTLMKERRASGGMLNTALGRVG